MLVLQRICSRQHFVSGLHLCVSVWLYLVEKTPYHNMGRWQMLHPLTCWAHNHDWFSWFDWTPAGWSVESLQEWGSYMKLAIPSTLMTCFEWWVYEFGGFFAGNWRSSSIHWKKAFVQYYYYWSSFLLKRNVCNSKCVCNYQECWVKKSWPPSMQSLWWLFWLIW